MPRAIFHFFLLCGASRARGSLELKFCNEIDDVSSNLLDEPSQASKEIWKAWNLNQSHFTTAWHPTPDICDANVTSYFVDVRVSNFVINTLLGILGGFPQDICSPTSMLLRFVNTKGKRPNPCAPYSATDCEPRRLLLCTLILLINSYVLSL